MNFVKACRVTFIIMLLFGAQETFSGPLLDSIIERSVLGEDEPSSETVSLPKGVRLLRDIPYGNDAKQIMDVYAPLNATHAPVVFMVHGGAWRTGDKSMRTVVENKVARWTPKGIIFISVNYRLLPKADPLQQTEDVAHALAFAQANAASWGGDPFRFILMGHSAGAHIVDLLASAPSKAFVLGAQPWLGTISLDSAAMDVVQIMESKHYRLYDKAFGSNAALWRSTSPFHVLEAGAAPILAVCSTKRPDKPCMQANSFAKKAASLGIRVKVLEQKMTHKQINAELGMPGGYTESVETFMMSLDDSLAKALTK